MVKLAGGEGPRDLGADVAATKQEDVPNVRELHKLLLIQLVKLYR